ncbi:MAG: hypothetical protein JSR46_02455 [Verrucomicrobia bacterium]|nr:hypothetical protein [Verrucomicrobiota bacterium]
MTTQSMGFPGYGTEVPVTLESERVREGKKPCECCWKGRKVMNKCSCGNFVGLLVSAAATTVTGFLIRGAVVLHRANQDIGLQVVFTVIFGCVTVGCYAAAIWSCCRDYRSAPPEENETNVLLDE